MSATGMVSSITTNVVDSLTKSFGLVPSAAVPAIVDCVLTSTGIATSSLFDSLLNTFSQFTQEMIEEPERKNSIHPSYITSFTTALCYLLKKSGTAPNALRSFIWRGFIPAMRILNANDHELLIQITELLCDVVTKTDTWAVIEVTLVPFSLRLIGISIDMLENEKSALYKWSKHSIIQGPNNKLNELDVLDSMPDLSVPLPLPILCHILTSLLNASLKSNQAEQRLFETMVVNGCSAKEFARKLHSDLCDMAVRLLSQSSEHRTCTIRLLLPFIFTTFSFDSSFKPPISWQAPVLRRKYFFAEIWKCCRKMFTLGSLERKDAYTVLSLYLSHAQEYKDVTVDNGTEEFDISAEKEFWDEIKRGVVDKEGSVRKQSLHILKVSLQRNDGIRCHTSVSETILQNSEACDMTKRGQWAEKEAKSLGVGRICKADDLCLNGQQRWEAFILLYEMLEEYGTHLVEAAWNHQISLLLKFSFPLDPSTYPISGVYQNQLETLEGTFSWLSVLWQRGLCHENPQVRCLIMQSILDIDWRGYGNCAKLVPGSFILGPFIQGLNDVVHHRDFGINGVYSSKTIEGAADFLYHYSSSLCGRERVAFLCNLASLVKQEAFGRAGLMALSVCIASAARADETCSESEQQWCETFPRDMVLLESSKAFANSRTYLLDTLKLVIESSKQHFNPNYRVRVCEKILDAACSVICTSDVPIETLEHFFSTVPREFTDYGGSLRGKVQEWFSGWTAKRSSHSNTTLHVLNALCDFPEKFTKHQSVSEASAFYDDEDLEAWSCEAQRWARLLFLAVTKESQLESVFKFLQYYGVSICRQNNHGQWNPSKFLVLILSLLHELPIMQEKSANFSICYKEVSMPESSVQLNSTESFTICEKFNSQLLFILDELVSFAESASSTFWSSPKIDDEPLPYSVRGKLGGPSQRRLASSISTSVLKAILSMRTVSSVLSWSTQFGNDRLHESTFSFLWKFSWKVISSPRFDTETGAEVRLAAYEALAPVLKALSSAISPLGLDLMLSGDQSLVQKEAVPQVDTFILSFLHNINDLLEAGILARSRRAVLMNWKWICLVSLLSIPYHANRNGVHLGGTIAFFSGAAIRCIFVDLVESLENAGESSVLPILRSVRLVLELFTSGTMSSVVSVCGAVDTQMMSELTHSSWIFHVSCNKRRVAHIAALLSSVLHSSVFSDKSMHESTNRVEGPLKLFVEQILDEGTKSPRTIRLAALHLTGLWLLYPKTIKYYIKDLKLLSLHGSVAFDEDFEAELGESHDARLEVSLLAKSPDPELTEVFINTELYARVSVAVLFSKLADMADKLGSLEENEDCHAALHSGKLFLLELLDSAVNDNDLSKELYKKYSGIHRRKVRAWQMICILSRFVDEDIVQQVTASLHVCLYRNNLPAVRQYLETFAIQIYLKFPLLVAEQLVPIFRDYNMRPQALSSYVFVAANVILHTADEQVQFKHLDQILPPIIPLLTSHHHSLRGFTQLLVYHILRKLVPSMEVNDVGLLPLEKRCFEDLKSFLGKNTDCVREFKELEFINTSVESDGLDGLDGQSVLCCIRPAYAILQSVQPMPGCPSTYETKEQLKPNFKLLLRESMEWFLDAFNPNTSSAPSGIFTARSKELEFECVPTSLMENVTSFLNEVREDLRCSMAKDAALIKNESLAAGGTCNDQQVPRDVSVDFQKKVTLSKHERPENRTTTFSDTTELCKPLIEMEKEDGLLNQVVQSRSMAMERIKASRQQLIIVASLLDRIPNLAGLARTCEVFKTAGLAIADTSVLHDKQFQLISVTAEKWVPIIEVPVSSIKVFLEKKKREGFSILGLEQTANSVPLDQYTFPKKMVLVLGREKEGIPVDIIHVLDGCVEIPQLGVVRSLNVHVSGAIALWEYTRQQRTQ